MNDGIKHAIVTTTIHVPTLLKKYVQNLSYHGHSGQEVTFIIVGDKKTPPSAASFCKELEKSSDHAFVFFDVERQLQYLEKFPKFRDFLPWNCIQRRNVGLLYAYEEGFDVITTIDDDNLVTSDDFLGIPGHGMTGRIMKIIAVESSTGWFNPCSLLRERNGQIFYHRGYPLEQRGTEGDSFYSTSMVEKKVVVNAGLWIDDPDIDAITRMNFPIQVVGLQPEHQARNIALMPGTWAPFNSQNTSLSREVIPAYFLSPHVGRYDDIWASYIVRVIADHLKHLVSYGHPLVRQKRNEHDLFKDLELEVMGMELTSEFCSVLRRCQLDGTSYHDCYHEIIQQLEMYLNAQDSSKIKKYLKPMALFVKGMRTWHELFEKTFF